MDLAADAFHLRHALEGLTEMRAQEIHVRAGLVEQMAYRTALLIEQRRHDVHGLDVLMVAPDGERLRVRERKLKLAGEFVHPHRCHSRR